MINKSDVESPEEIARKKKNTIFFIVAATIFNIITTVLVFLIMFFLFFFFIRSLINENYVIWALPILFLVSIFASYMIYKTLLRFVLKKIDTDKYFDPMIKTRRKG